MVVRVNQRLNRTVTKDGVLEWINREAYLVIEKIRRALNDVVDGYTSPSGQVVQGHLARFTNTIGTLIEDAGRQLVTREISGRRVVFLAAPAEPDNASVPDGDGIVHLGEAATSPVAVPESGSVVWNDPSFGVTVLGNEGQLATTLPIGDGDDGDTQFNSIKLRGRFYQPSDASLQTIASFAISPLLGRGVRNASFLVRTTSVAFGTETGDFPGACDALELVASVRVDEAGVPELFGMQSGNGTADGIVAPGEVFDNAVITVVDDNVRLSSEFLSEPSFTRVYTTFEIFGFHNGPPE